MLQHKLERLEPYTTYKIKMTIEWKSWGRREFAPWTSILETTLSEGI